MAATTLSNISVSESGYYKITLDPVKRTCTMEKVANQTPKTFASMFISGAFNDWATTTSMHPVNTFDGAVNHDWYFDLDATSGSTEAKFLPIPTGRTTGVATASPMATPRLRVATSP